MAKKEKFTDKLKEGVSVEEIENFARKYTMEVFSSLAIIIAAISSTFDFFTGPGWSLMLGALAAVLGIVFPKQIDAALGKFYGFVVKQEKSTQIIIGVVKIVIALFVPFIIFILVGCLAGSAYHNYMRNPFRGSKGGSSHSGSHSDEL